MPHCLLTSICAVHQVHVGFLRLGSRKCIKKRTGDETDLAHQGARIGSCRFSAPQPVLLTNHLEWYTPHDPQQIYRDLILFAVCSDRLLPILARKKTTGPSRSLAKMRARF
jgi:hypothetical protein